MERIVWGLDIGGTKCAICASDETGRIFGRMQVATADYADWRALVDALLSYGRAELPAPLAVGVSCGGPLDSRSGLILSPPNLPGWDEVPITNYITQCIGAPAFLQNDANACALAEWRFGAGRGCDNMVFLTFGTGMGAGLILNGRLYTGTNDMAGEVGHMRMTDEGPIGYSKAGSFEGYCSGGGLRQLAMLRLGKDLDAKQLVQAAEAGDESARSVLTESARRLGEGLSILIDILNPQRIVIGSVYARAERWFHAEAMRVIEREALALSRGVCEIVPAQLGDAIGDVAAATIAWNGLEERI